MRMSPNSLLGRMTGAARTIIPKDGYIRRQRRHDRLWSRSEESCPVRTEPILYYRVCYVLPRSQHDAGCKTPSSARMDADSKQTTRHTLKRERVLNQERQRDDVQEPLSEG